MGKSKLKRYLYIAVAIAAIAVSLPNLIDSYRSDGVISDVSLILSGGEQSGNHLPDEEPSVSNPAGRGGEEPSSSRGQSHSNNPYHWGNLSTLQDHFDRHGGDFNAESPDDYAEKANAFYKNRDEYQVKVDEKGVVRIYDPDTNTFGAYNKNGSTRSFYKPSGGQDYFDRQPGD